MMLKEKMFTRFVSQNIDLLQYIKTYFPLEQHGNIFKAKCPFCDDKLMSFTVDPEKNIFYCFKCHSSGDSVSFAARRHDLSQTAAAKHLLQQAMAELEVEGSSEEVNRHETLLHLLYSVFEFSRAKSPLLLKKGFGQAILGSLGEDFGYFPGGAASVQELIDRLAPDEVKLAEELSILIKGPKTTFSPLEERLLFITNNGAMLLGYVFADGDARPKIYKTKIV